MRRLAPRRGRAARRRSGSSTSGPAAARSPSRSPSRCGGAGARRGRDRWRRTSRPRRLDLARENAVGHAVADAIALRARPTCCRRRRRPRRRSTWSLANLPYVRHDAMPGLPVAASFEPRARARRRPRRARRSSSGCSTRLPDALAADGVALLEIGADQGDGDRRRGRARCCRAGAARSSRTWPACRGSPGSRAADRRRPRRGGRPPVGHHRPCPASRPRNRSCPSS